LFVSFHDWEAQNSLNGTVILILIPSLLQIIYFIYLAVSWVFESGTRATLCTVLEPHCAVQTALQEEDTNNTDNFCRILTIRSCQQHTTLHNHNRVYSSELWGTWKTGANQCVFLYNSKPSQT